MNPVTIRAESDLQREGRKLFAILIIAVAAIAPVAAWSVSERRDAQTQLYVQELQMAKQDLAELVPLVDQRTQQTIDSLSVEIDALVRALKEDQPLTIVEVAKTSRRSLAPIISEQTAAEFRVTAVLLGVIFRRIQAVYELRATG